MVYLARLACVRACITTIVVIYIFCQGTFLVIWVWSNVYVSCSVGLDNRGKCFVTFDLRGTLKRRKKKSRKCLSEKSGEIR